MNSNFLFILLFTFLFVAKSAYSFQNTDSNKSGENQLLSMKRPSPILKRSYIKLGINQNYFLDKELPDYNSAQGAQVIFCSNGDIFGYTAMFNLNGVLHTPNTFSLFTSINFEIGRGKHLLQSDIVQNTDTIRILNKFINLDFHIGPEIKILNHHYSIFTGCEYKYWNSVWNSNTYTTIKWLNIPIGIQTEFNISKKTTIGIVFINRLMVYGSFVPVIPTNTFFNLQEKIKLPESKLVNKYGFQVEIPIQFKLLKVLGVEFKPWFCYRPFGESELTPMYINSPSEELYIYIRTESHSYYVGLLLSLFFGKSNN